MELWIRSQSRQNLMKVNDIVVVYNKILVYKDDDTSTEIGEYKTKERALEVLDDIQNILMLKQTWDLNEDAFKISCKNYNEEDIEAIIKKMEVYEMPKE